VRLQGAGGRGAAGGGGGGQEAAAGGGGVSHSTHAQSPHAPCGCFPRASQRPQRLKSRAPLSAPSPVPFLLRTLHFIRQFSFPHARNSAPPPPCHMDKNTLETHTPNLSNCQLLTQKRGLSVVENQAGQSRNTSDVNAAAAAGGEGVTAASGIPCLPQPLPQLAHLA
jgi:hypothetical protein